MATEIKRTVKTVEEINASREKRARINEERERKELERSNHNQKVRSSWNKVKKELAIEETITFLKTRREMLVQTSSTGVGQIEKVDANGKSYFEKMLFTNEQRISQMERVAAIDELLAYLDRHMA